jgi:hypothetical protein
MQNRLELWGEAKRKRIELSEELKDRSHEARDSFISFSSACFFESKIVASSFTFACS